MIKEFLHKLKHLISQFILKMCSNLFENKLLTFIPSNTYYNRY